ncbi:DUF4157 domain-containing protein [Roseofilum sp. BLCC_M91]|uniref:DUF4157 domain-containing protein n=1 Tax=Roseofilum halophilum BLCC-M91 TaxID=3022259 RepID=A0ABT7BG57_9CYAN|nr:DUF4157 domain-containing protein [Roseofilum halophilum]MDJ1178164.1 DUF4157 domain-containing protein [Roseofilum halophilum BLCC-M91]
MSPRRRQTKTRISRRQETSENASPQFAAPPVIQPKIQRKIERELPEWKPGGNSKSSPLQRLQPSAALQAKLEIGQPNDPYEQQANTVAHNVVKQINSPVSNDAQQHPTVQRQTQESNLPLRLKPTGRQASLGGGKAPTQLESSINHAKSSGKSLDPSLQRSMGTAMGVDFSGVKIHTDAQANQLSESIQAKAFTTGQNIFFKQGEYQPQNRGGQELIAHELTHVVQQSSEGTYLQRDPIPDVIKVQWNITTTKTEAINEAVKKYNQDIKTQSNEDLARSGDKNKIQERIILLVTIWTIAEQWLQKQFNDKGLSFLSIHDDFQDSQDDIEDLQLDEKDLQKITALKDKQNNVPKTSQEPTMEQRGMNIAHIYNASESELESFKTELMTHGYQLQVDMYNCKGQTKSEIAKELGTNFIKIAWSGDKVAAEGVFGEEAKNKSLSEQMKGFFNEAKKPEEAQKESQTNDSNNAGQSEGMSWLNKMVSIAKTVCEFVKENFGDSLFSLLSLIKNIAKFVSAGLQYGEFWKAYQAKLEKNDNPELLDVLKYGYDKNERRVWSALADVVGSAVSVLALILTATGLPIVGGAIALGKTVLSFIGIVIRKAKGLYKWFMGTRGKHRHESARNLMLAAYAGDPEALDLMIEIKPSINSKTDKMYDIVEKKDITEPTSKEQMHIFVSKLFNYQIKINSKIPSFSGPLSPLDYQKKLSEKFKSVS